MGVWREEGGNGVITISKIKEKIKSVHDDFKFILSFPLAAFKLVALSQSQELNNSYLYSYSSF